MEQLGEKEPRHAWYLVARCAGGFRKGEGSVTHAAGHPQGRDGEKPLNLALVPSREPCK